MQVPVQTSVTPQLLRDAAIDGARHASNVLTRWLGRYVRIDAEGFCCVPQAELPARLTARNEPAAAVRMEIAGALAGQALLSMPRISAEHLAAILLGMTDLPDLAGDEVARSCLREIGNTVGGAYLGSIGTWLGRTVSPVAPQVAFESPTVRADLLRAGPAVGGDTALLATTDFHFQDVSIGSVFCLLPAPESMALIDAYCRRFAKVPTNMW